MEYDFGIGQAKITIDSTMLRYRQPGKGESSVPLSQITGIAYESEILYGYCVILGAGTKLDRIRLPKRGKSREVTEKLSRDISNLIMSQSKPT